MIIMIINFQAHLDLVDRLDLRVKLDLRVYLEPLVLLDFLDPVETG